VAVLFRRRWPEVDVLREDGGGEQWRRLGRKEKWWLGRRRENVSVLSVRDREGERKKTIVLVNGNNFIYYA
jgi:hypothetical protein